MERSLCVEVLVEVNGRCITTLFEGRSLIVDTGGFFLRHCSSVVRSSIVGLAKLTRPSTCSYTLSWPLLHFPRNVRTFRPTRSSLLNLRRWRSGGSVTGLSNNADSLFAGPWERKGGLPRRSGWSTMCNESNRRGRNLEWPFT